MELVSGATWERNGYVVDLDWLATMLSSFLRVSELVLASRKDDKNQVDRLSECQYEQNHSFNESKEQATVSSA